MNLLIYTECNKEVGSGHIVRMKVLADRATKGGHKVFVLTDYNTNWGKTVSIKTKPGDVGALQRTLELFPPDWVIIDGPNYVPETFFPAIHKAGAKICLIDGVGKPIGEADVVISQGLDGEFSAPEYLLLRPELKKYRWNGMGYHPLVWGGAADMMDLLPTFCEYQPEAEAWLISPEFSNTGIHFYHNNRWIVNPSDETMFTFMATCSKAVIATGMICWELASLQVPIYAFSRSARHLRTALQMQDLGYLLAWPEIGLPDRGKFLDFISQPFRPGGTKVDLRGPERVLELLEERL